MTEEYKKLQEKFHYMSGTYIAGKIFAEYAFGLKEFFNHKVKGDTTRFNRANEAESKAVKLINLLSEDLKKIGCDLSITDNEVDNLEGLIHAHLQLNEVNQKRVMNLITKLKKQETEL